MLTVHTLALETQLFIERDRPLVIAEHSQLHSMQVQFLKREPERELQRLGPVTLTLQRRVADRDAQPDMSVHPHNTFELEETEQLVTVDWANGEEVAIGRAVVLFQPGFKRVRRSGGSWARIEQPHE